MKRSDGACTGSLNTLRVEVLDTYDEPVPGASVVATHLDSGRTLRGTTGERGVSTAINESLGAGSTRVEAFSGPKVSPAVEVTWTCGECHCEPVPASVSLHLNL